MSARESHGGEGRIRAARFLARRAANPAASLEIARNVSTAIIDVVRGAVAAEPAWIIAKGGIPSHEVAVRGLGIQGATVLGQLLPGLVSVFKPVPGSTASGFLIIEFSGSG